MIRKFVIEGHIKSGQQLAFWTLLISTFIDKKAAFSYVNGSHTNLCAVKLQTSNF